jgi:hypothetical protein
MEAWRQWPLGGRTKPCSMKPVNNQLDSERPSHGRRLHSKLPQILARLMETGELPLFAPDAMVEHSIPLSLLEALRKDLQSAYLERQMYETIAASGVKIYVTHRERLQLLSSMCQTARCDSIGRSAWFVLFLRQSFKRVLSFGYHCLSLIHAKQSSTQANRIFGKSRGLNYSSTRSMHALIN